MYTIGGKGASWHKRPVSAVEAASFKSHSSHVRQGDCGGGAEGRTRSRPGALGTARRRGVKRPRLVQEHGPDRVRALLAAGANVNAADQRGFTALILAGRYGHTATAQALLAAGAQIEAKDNTATTGF
eukprot:g8.t1